MLCYVMLTIDVLVYNIILRLFVMLITRMLCSSIIYIKNIIIYQRMDTKRGGSFRVCLFRFRVDFRRSHS